MRTIGQLLMGLTAAALLVAAFPATARADAFDRETILTFSGPVALPTVALPAGTYVFTLADPYGDPSVVRVFNRDQTVCYGTFLTIPDSRLSVSSRPVVTFEERAAGTPQAIEAWFYPDNGIGREFVYPDRSGMTE